MKKRNDASASRCAENIFNIIKQLPIPQTTGMIKNTWAECGKTTASSNLHEKTGSSVPPSSLKTAWMDF
ncbi:MAG TPA: hypothetical protein HPP95_10270 [Deltaproteobacteria bacterium]|nr:hypothetical protein [Deltaproteobacteria bacterium]